MSTHDAGVGFLLYEGNEGAGLIIDDIHGTENFVTSFRSLLIGRDLSKTQSTIPLENQAYSRYTNMVGNVLGYPGYHTTYQGTGTSNCDKSIYCLGWQGNSGGGTFDSLVGSTIVRWGNYSVVSQSTDTPANSGIRFLGSEMPSGLSLYANAVPSSQILPASFFLSSKPTWWPNTTPWPPIGPDVTGGNIPNYAGHAYSIPARDCYLNVMGGSLTTNLGSLAFNADGCYPAGSGGGTPPAAPSGLSAVVQ